MIIINSIRSINSNTDYRYSNEPNTGHRVPTLVHPIDSQTDVVIHNVFETLANGHPAYFHLLFEIINLLIS